MTLARRQTAPTRDAVEPAAPEVTEGLSFELTVRSTDRLAAHLDKPLALRLSFPDPSTACRSRWMSHASTEKGSSPAKSGAFSPIASRRTMGEYVVGNNVI